MKTYRVSFSWIIEWTNSIDEEINTLMVGVVVGMAIHN